VCGDLHHGERPLDALAAYLEAEPHDAVLLTFNPAMLSAVQQRLSVPVRALPPTFFRYPAAERVPQPRLELLHVGSLGTHHPRRRELAATLYAQHALVLNGPLNHDLNHRLFEGMAAGAPQVVFGDPALKSCMPWCCGCLPNPSACLRSRWSRQPIRSSRISLRRRLRRRCSRCARPGGAEGP
jgi:hypothetical protein